MKILHVVSTLTDGFSYQENYLTKYQKKLGFDVSAITTCWIFGSNGKMMKIKPSEYYNKDGVKIIRLPLKSNKKFNYKFMRMEGLYQTIEKENPDVLFIHGFQFVYINDIVRYLKNKKITVYVDNHADYNNSATNWLSKNILHRVIWKHFAHKIRPYVTRFYGVTPARVDILTELYGIPKSECELLIMGADDELVLANEDPAVKEKLRLKYGITKNEFLIVTGGKFNIDKKQILQLMDIVNKCKNKKVKLLIFGSVDKLLKEQFDRLCSKRVIYVGWIPSQDSYKYIAAADLVVYPFKHSVFWEQTVAQGKPMIVRRLEGTTHVDLGGNVEYFEDTSTEEIRKVLTEVLSEEKYAKMLSAAQSSQRKNFLYSRIAKQSIRDVLEPTVN